MKDWLLEVRDRAALVLALTLLFISGCATTSPRVDVPIAVACKVETPKEPTYRYAPPYSSLFEAVRDMLGDRELALAYEEELRKSLKVCQ
jgi:hypothetical protein